MKQYQLYIDGQFVNSQGNRFISVINPATEQVISQIPDGTSDDVDIAVAAAHVAQKSWKKLSSTERAKYLMAMAAEIRANKDMLARTITEEMGKILPLAEVEVDFTADYFEYMAGWARKYEGEILPSDREKENILMFKQPLGVIGGILPWNFPFFLIARKAGPALLTGNTIVIKPSELAPNNAFEFAKLVHKIGLPKGVINFVSGTGPVAGHSIASHPKISMVSLTGSYAAGVAVTNAAAANVTKLNLELGGKAPCIVMDDADLDMAVKSVVDSRIINTGQVCNCAERIYVQEGIADEFIKRITDAMSKVTYGDPLAESGLQMGPLITEAALLKVEQAVANATAQGAVITTGGKRADKGVGFHYEPTVLINTNNQMDIMRDEIFGPVLPITTFKTLDEAIELANDCEFGLASAIYTTNLNTMMRVANELEFGETYVNRENFEAMQGYHAGWRKSGVGGADGRHGLEEYLQTHTVYIQYQ